MAAALRERLSARWAKVVVTDPQAMPEATGADLVLADVPPDDQPALERALGLARRLRDTAVPMIVLGDALDRDARIALFRAGTLACLDPWSDKEEFRARLESLLGAKRPAARALRRLRAHTRYLDEQLRLAQRLQMDFLPRRLPSVPGGAFAARLEPAAWVAGDFYDVFRLDEEHVGFYVADAVGHGVPAALLTVFVKQSLQTKRIEGHDYELIPPGEALRLLNADLHSAQLREAPFITMVYGIYDMAARTVTYAKAGHPPPIEIGTEGRLTELDAEGPLLGVFRDAEFETRTHGLEPGRRLILYSDGASRVEPICRENPDGFREILQSGALLPLETMLDEVMAAVRGASGDGRLADDVTLVALERDAAEA